MKQAACAGFLLCLGAAVGTAAAGNQEMMEQKARELIQLNEQIVRQLDGVGKDSQVSFEARVTSTPEGDRVIYIDRATIVPAPAEVPVGATAEAPAGARATARQTFIRLGPIPQGEALAVPGLDGGGAALQLYTDQSTLQGLLDADPAVRTVQLKGAMLAPPAGAAAPQVGRGLLIYW